MRIDEFCSGIITAAALVAIGVAAAPHLNGVPGAAPLAIAPPDAVKQDDYAGLPPIQLQTARTVRVRFLEGEAVNRECGHMKEDRAMACANGNTIIAENPCSYVARNSRDYDLFKEDMWVITGRKDDWFQGYKRGEYSWIIDTNKANWGDPTRLWAYTTMLCHELGHVNGWPGDHWHTKELP